MEQLEKIPYSTPHFRVLWFEPAELITASAGDGIFDGDYDDDYGNESDGW